MSEKTALDGFIDLSQAAELEGKTTRTIRNWIDAKKFPQPDAVRDGRPIWRRSTYRKYEEAVLAGEYRGRDRLAHLKAARTTSGAA